MGVDAFMIDKKAIEKLISALGLTSYEIVKQSSCCVVVETPEHFYNIRRFDSDNPTIDFERVVSKAFAEEYAQMGIDWSFEELVFGGSLYFVERREKLRVLTPKDCSLEQAINKSSKVSRKIERELGFGHLVAQVRQELQMCEVSCACVARKINPKHDDFALIDGHIICFSNQNRFLALGNSEGFWERDRNDIVKLVHLKIGNFYLASKNECSHNANNCLTCFGEWWLYSESVGEELLMQREKNFQELEEMNSANLKILVSKKTGDCFNESHQKDERCNQEDKSIDNACGNEEEPLVTHIDEGVLRQTVELELKSGCCSKVLKDFNYYQKELLNVSDIKIINATLTNPCEDEFWCQLESHASSDAVNNLWAVTQLNPNGEIIKNQEFRNWSSHMRTIDSFYPQVKKLISVYLTEEFCESYLKGNFDTCWFNHAFGSMVGFVPPKSSGTFPARKLFRDFLRKFIRVSEGLFNLCFFLHNLISASSLDLTFPIHVDAMKSPHAIQREHMDCYSCYSDCTNSMLCDVAQIMAVIK